MITKRNKTLSLTAGIALMALALAGCGGAKTEVDAHAPLVMTEAPSASPTPSPTPTNEPGYPLYTFKMPEPVSLASVNIDLNESMKDLRPAIKDEYTEADVREAGEFALGTVYFTMSDISELKGVWDDEIPDSAHLSVFELFKESLHPDFVKQWTADERNGLPFVTTSRNGGSSDTGMHALEGNGASWETVSTNPTISFNKNSFGKPLTFEGRRTDTIKNEDHKLMGVTSSVCNYTYSVSTVKLDGKWVITDMTMTAPNETDGCMIPKLY